MTTSKIALCAAAAWLAAGMVTASAQPAAAQAQPARPRSSMTQNLPEMNEAELKAKHPELYVLPPVSKAFQARKTAWGEPDLRGMWPIDSLGGLPLQRAEKMGNRVFLSDEEIKARDYLMQQWRQAASEEDRDNKLGSGNWVEMTGAGRRTSFLVDPLNGRLPELTAEGKRLDGIGRSSWVRNQTYEWTTDFDSWDRCITRGFPASMLPFRYNNGVQIMQAPGYVIVNLEMIHDARIIPTDGRRHHDPRVRTYMGESIGHWEGNTLVIETDNIKTGAAPLNMATIGAPPNNTIPMSEKAHVTERLTPTGPDTLTYEMTYSDPVIWTAPFTIRADWTRNSKYRFFEYACHEGDEQVRNYIVTDRIKRAKAPAPVAEAAPAQPQASRN